LIDRALMRRDNWSSIFDFGRGGSNNNWSFNFGNPELFYSRRIGRSPQVLPGSTLYFVWTNDRANYENQGELNLANDFTNLWKAETDNVLTTFNSNLLAPLKTTITRVRTAIAIKNVGEKGAPKLVAKKSIKVNWGDSETPKPPWNWWNPQKGELVTQWRTTPFAIDWNNDGLTDLISLDHEGYLTFFERFSEGNKLLLHPGKHIFYNDNNEKLKLNKGEAGSSGRRKFTIVDWDNDGDLDFFLNSTNVDYYENISENSDKVVLKNNGLVFQEILAGHTTSPTIVNWDGDNKHELLIGAEDGHLYFVK